MRGDNIDDHTEREGDRERTKYEEREYVCVRERDCRGVEGREGERERERGRGRGREEGREGRREIERVIEREGRRRGE